MTKREVIFPNPLDPRFFDDIPERIEKSGDRFAPAHDVEGDVPLENMLAFIETAQQQPGYVHM